MNDQEPEAAHQQSLRLRRDAVRDAAEELAAAWSSCRAWLSRLAQNAKPASSLLGDNTDDRIERQLIQNTVQRSRVEKTTFLNRFSGAELRSTFDSRIAPWSEANINRASSSQSVADARSPAVTAAFRQ
jgi:hypothetical protein